MNLVHIYQLWYTFELNTNLTKSYVTKLRLHYPLLFILIVAFISMQWASAHIHLAEKHDHDEIHYHETDSHSYNLTYHYSETVSSSHLADASSTIELDNQYNAPSGKNKTPDLATISQCFQQLSYAQIARLELPFTDNISYGHIDQSAANPRAPPYFS